MSNLIKPSMRYSLLFKIISECNDSCNFCLEHKLIKTKRPALSLDELKENYFYFKKNHNIDYVILTGGEPTLHPQFFEIIDFLKQEGVAFRVITNFLKFNEKDFLKKLKICFSDPLKKKQENQNKIIGSINDLPERGPIAKKRFLGLKKALMAELPLMVTVMIYRDNLKDLPKISRRLKNFFKRHGALLYIEFRLIYIEGTLPTLLKKSLPANFQRVKKSVKAAIKILDASKINITLWNFPLCYLDDPEKVKNEAMAERQTRQLIKIHKDAQLENAEIRDWEIYLKANQICRKCSLNNFCSGIDSAYIGRYNFPLLKPF